MSGSVTYSTCICIYEIVKREKQEQKWTKEKYKLQNYPSYYLCYVLYYIEDDLIQTTCACLAGQW